MNITGPSYQSRSKPLSSQVTQNWYQQYNESGKEKYTLLPFPGLKTLSSVAGEDRGFHRMAEILYQVKGGLLYSIDRFGTTMELGAIPGTSRAIMADDGENLFIVADLKVWRYSTLTGLVTQVTDSNIDGSNSVAFINNQFLYTKTGFTTTDSGSRVGPGYTTVSDVGDGSSANGLNIVGADSNPDALIRDYVFDEAIYRFGERTIETWYNSGAGNPPIERLQGRIFTVGLAAIHSIAQTDQAFYWLGDDHAIYRAAAGREERISTDAISNELQKHADISDSIGNTFTIEGQNFYMLTVPAANRTFVINESLGVNGWFELSCGVNNPQQSSQYCVSSIISAYGQTICADYSNGSVYKLDFDTYTDNGEPLQRVRVTQSVNGDMLNAKGERVQMSCMKIIMETGVGIIEGQGDNPRIMIEYSDDGGRTWNGGSWSRVGRLGEFTLQVEWFNLGSFYDRIFRLSTTDPVNYSVYSATIDLRLAGK